MRSLILALVMLMIGCRRQEPGLSIRVIHKGDTEYAFAFSECGRGAEYSPRYVEVFDMSGGGRVSACRATWNRAVRSSWTYGDGSADRSSNPCLPLQIGKLYAIEATGAGNGFARFEIRSDGTPRVLKASCASER
jgi:hypothetical protein